MRVYRECRGFLAASRVILAGAVACGLVYYVGRTYPGPQLTTHTPGGLTTHTPGGLTTHTPGGLTSPDIVSQGRQECQAMFTVDKGGHDVIWYTDAQYQELGRQLPALLSDVGIHVDNATNIVSGRTFMGPRLSLMDGTVPYIPCQIQQYDMLGVAQCSAARAARGARTWVAFVGDSKQRQKTHSFMSFLPPELTYTYFLGNKEVTQAEFTYAVAHHRHRPPTFDIVGKPRPNANSKTFTSPRVSATNPRGSTVTATNPRASTVTTTNPRASTVTITNPRASTVTTTNPRASTNQKTSTTMTTTTTSHGENLTNIHPNTELNLNSDNSDLVVQEDINYYPKKSNDTNTHINHVENVGNNDPFSFVEMEKTGKNRTKEPYDFSYSEDDLLDDDPRLNSYELRVTLVWAPFGTRRDNYLDLYTRPRKVTKLEEWVKAEVIPDVIVTGFGSWMLIIRKDVDELAPFPELNKLGLQVLPIFANLARRTRVLFLSQSRYRWFNFEGTKQLPNDPKGFWKNLLYMGQFRDALPLVDAWLWRIFRSTGMWHWDSTLPFNLANIRECHMLWNNSALYEPLYTDSWWHCPDVHHASYETNHDEIQMLLNLLCNPYLTRARNYCCSVT